MGLPAPGKVVKVVHDDGNKQIEDEEGGHHLNNKIVTDFATKKAKIVHLLSLRFIYGDDDSDGDCKEANYSKK